MSLEVPRYDEPTVRQAPIPGPRRQPEAPIEAFGGGRAAEGVFRAAGELGQANTQMIQAGFEREADAAIRDNVAQLSALEAKHKAKAESLKGQDAFGATDQAMKDFDTDRDKLLAGIGNRYVKDRVSAHADSFRQSLFHASELHVAGQREDYSKKNTLALIKNERDNAITGYVDPNSPAKPSRVMQAIARQRAAVADQLKGQSPETVASAQAIEESATHSQVLERMLASGNDALAGQYYAANQAGFYGDDKTQAERALNHGSYVGNATRETDRIFAPTFGTIADGGAGPTITPGAQNMDDVRKETSKIQDPKLRQAVEQMARQRLDDIDHAKKQKARDSYEEATQLVDANPDVKPEFLLRGGQWTALPAEYRDALTRRGIKETDDSKAWLSWMDFARDHQQTAALPRADFDAQFWSKLTPAHREAAVKEWQSAGEAASKAGAKLAEYKSIWTDREMVLNGLKRGEVGGIAQDDTLKSIEEDETKRKTYSDYLDRVDQAFLKYSVDHDGKMPNDLEKKDIISRMTWREKTVKLYRKWWIDPEKQVKDLTDEEIKRVDSGFDEIPVTSIDTMRQKARSYGLVLDATRDPDKLRLARAYAAAILGKDDLVRAILSGKD